MTNTLEEQEGSPCDHNTMKEKQTGLDPEGPGAMALVQLGVLEELWGNMAFVQAHGQVFTGRASLGMG